MENGVEALKIAGSMLIFVLAITITISTFTTATQALHRIFEMKNREQYVAVTDEDSGEEYFLNYVRIPKQGTREVGVETIIPSIYRAYVENYAIYFYDSSGEPIVLYERTKNGTTEKVNYIDLVQDKIDINELLYGDSLYSGGLYDKYLQGKTFIEKLGEYYMDDVAGETTTAEVNKIKKRVILYIEKSAK